jgi:hypothetical protein
MAAMSCDPEHCAKRQGSPIELDRKILEGAAENLLGDQNEVDLTGDFRLVRMYCDTACVKFAVGEVGQGNPLRDLDQVSPDQREMILAKAERQRQADQAAASEKYINPATNPLIKTED